MAHLLPRSTLRLAVLALCALTVSRASAQHLSDYVNPLRGSDSTPGYSRGNTFPAVTLPFGFNFWTPMTDANSERWLYAYDSGTLNGFSASHEPSPWIGDHAALQLFPMTGSLQVDADQRASRFSHDRETSRAHYYSVELDRYGIKVEFTPTDHAVVFRFTYPDAQNATLLFDTIDSVNGALDVDQNGRTVTGYVDHNGPRFYFYATISKAIAGVEDPAGSGLNKALRFGTSAGEQVIVNLGTSFLSVDQARANLAQEVGDKSFEAVRNEAQAAWDRALGRVEIEGASESQKVTFYSNLYRAFMYPNSMWESVDGSPKYASPYAGGVKDGHMYVNNGFWDTFRAAWPLYSLLVPEQASLMLEGFVNAYRDGGWTPRWSGPGYIDIMVGSHSDIVFADAYLKGIDFDIQTAYASMLKNALVYSDRGHLGRKGQARSIFKGYIPVEDLGESAAWYLEDVINDFGISQVAKALGDDTHARYFRDKSLTYVNLFSDTTEFFRGRREDGTFRTSDADFRPNEWGHEFTEGCPWHYTMAAHNDPRGMANLYGGAAGLAAKIDAVFAADRSYLVGSYGGVIHEMVEGFDTNMGQYAHANEPIHHMLYMYNYAAMPFKTQERVRHVLDEASGVYGPGTGNGGGYLGDEDNGQMSAWYVFSAMGFYPASPGHPEYALGSPLFRKVTLHLDGGDFVIDAQDNSDDNRFVQEVELDGAAHSKNFLTHAQLSAGGTLTMHMGSAPSAWGTGADDVPTSITRTARAPRPMADRALGGTATASADNGANGEGAAQAFDDDSGTKWLSPNPTGSLTYQFAANRAYPVSLYTLTSGNDAPGRDPKRWTLEASNDGATWTTLDARDGEVFAERRQTRVFAVDNATPYALYRLNVTANAGDAITQLAELELLGDAPLEIATATGSTPCAEAEAPAHALDGRLRTKWCSSEPNASLTVDLGSDAELTQVALLHAGAAGEDVAWNTRAYRVEVSRDGALFEPVAEVADNTANDTQHTFAAHTARYVRLTVQTPSQNGDLATRIPELEIFGRRLGPAPGEDGGVPGGDGAHGDGAHGDGAHADGAAGDGAAGGDGSEANGPGAGESGCSCRVLGARSPVAPLALGLALLALLGLRRRRH